MHKYFLSYFGPPTEENTNEIIWDGKNIEVQLEKYNKLAPDRFPLHESYIIITIKKHRAVDEFSKALVDKSVAYKNEGKIKEAISLMNEYIFIHPRSPFGYKLRGILKTRNVVQDYNGAISDFTKSIQLDRSEGEVYLLRGLTYRVMKKFDQACTDIQHAVDLNDKEAAAFLSDCN